MTEKHNTTLLCSMRKLCDDHTIRHITHANQKGDDSILRMGCTFSRHTFACTYTTCLARHISSSAYGKRRLEHEAPCMALLPPNQPCPLHLHGHTLTVYGSYTVLRPRYTVYGDIHGIPYPDTDVCRLLAHTYIC